MKRSFDVVFSILLLLLLWPVLAGVAFLVRINLGGPIFFRQVRPGLQGVPFTMVKFRTMLNTVGADGALLPDEARATRFGHFLRSTSLDELPELWNVFKGEMSFVGPRPLLMEYLPLYTPEQARRHEVRPGITGWAQINGRNSLTWEDKFDLDVWYVDNRSFFLDLKIMLLTLKKVLGRDGINQDGSSTMERFRGSDAGISSK